MSITASLALTVPELILTVGALLLLLVAAFGGDGLSRAIGWGAVALFGAAAFSLTGPAGSGGPGFDGLYIADSFAAFAKLLIYIAAAISVLLAPGFFARAGGYRAEYPVQILLSAVGMGMMVSAGDLLTLYVGLELQSLSAYVLAGFLRR
ncbi:MAG: NADH-quinone oxidoreductase subunit N, partial [Rhizorhabdus sp.]|nr:NADH-quinone oxidoreductase subunit N [Rhizorhabdus sp.]